MRVALFPSKALVKWGLVTHLRKKRALLMLVAFMGVAMLGTAAFWPEGMLYQMASASQAMLMFVSMLFMGGALLFVPGLAAVTVTVEKEQDTFDQLFLTLIRPSGVIFAKLANVLGVYYLLVIGAMPVLGVIFFLVGVDWRQVMVMFALVTATAFSCGMAGILCSTFFRKTITAMITSYILALCLTGAPLLFFVLILTFMRFRTSAFERLLETLAQVCSPVVELVAAIAGGSFGPTAVHFGWSIAYQVGFGMLFFTIARWILTWAPKPPKVELRKPIDDVKVLERRRTNFPYYLIDPLRRKKPIEDRRNPMLVKELRWGFLGRADWLIRVFYGAVVLYMLTGIFIMAGIGRVNGGETMPFIIVQMLVTILVVPPLLANSASKEYEMGNMDFLRSTLLTPYQIVLGKVCAGVINLSPLLLASACVGLCMVGGVTLWFPSELPYLLAGYGSLAACVVLSLGVGMYSALSTRRTGVALVLGYGLSIMVYCGFAFFALLATMWLAPEFMRAGNSFDYYIGFLSPISAYVMSPGVYRTSYNIPWNQSTPINAYWFSNVVVFSLIGLGFLALSIIRFKYYGMKDK